MNWTDIPVAATTAAPAQQTTTPHAMITALEAAAKVYDARRDQFAIGKGQICRDMAAKLRKFGSFASDKQADFAAKLIEWTKPRAAAPVGREPLAVPLLFSILQKHADFFYNGLKISRKNGDSLCWIIAEAHQVCIGKIENGTVTYFPSKAAPIGVSRDAMEDTLRTLEKNPLEAAKASGRLSGRCCSCGRDLTDPDSIEAGIGPICAQKFA